MTSTRKAQINYPVAKLEIRSELPKEAIAASLNLIEQGIPANQSRHTKELKYVPTFQVGTLVAIIVNGLCTHTGTITATFDDSKSPDCIIDVWPTKDEVSVHNCASVGGHMKRQAASYLFEATAEDLDFIGRLSMLPKIDADHLRAQIAQVVPKNILEIFWTEDEIQELKVNQTAQVRYEKLATTLIESLES